MNYLYNGVELPELPELGSHIEDRDAYQYKTLFYGKAMSALRNVLTISDKKPYVDTEGKVNLPTDTRAIYYYARADNSEWSMIGSGVMFNGYSADLYFWTNTDICYEDGSVYLAASEPVPVGASTFTPDHISMTLGWLVGRRIAGQRGKQIEPDEPIVEPVAYLYGHVAKDGETPTHTINGVDYVGVVAPDIYTVYTPELQKTHHYVIIGKLGPVGHYLLITKYPVYVSADGHIHSTSENEDKVAFRLPPSGSDWGEHLSLNGGVVSLSSPPYWSSHIVLNEDGSVCLAASEPIPVYE